MNAIAAEGGAKVSEAELLSFYNGNRSKYEQVESVLLSHILVSNGDQAEVVKKLISKQSFTEVAKKYSSAFNLESKDIYGWIERGYSPGLEKSFKLGPGTTFGPITLLDGIHLFKVIEKKQYKLKSFPEVRGQVLSEVVALRDAAKFSSWLDVQIKRYRVKKNISMIDSIRVETR